ncbi:phosphatidylethanolamine-binding protein [Mycena floridula]|nr:phosphatidylethanolamine-binding protein [Mycena floridula]
MFSIALYALFISAAAAQNVGIEAIEAHFTQSGLVPSLLTSFDPSALLTATFASSGAITPGQALTEDKVATQPKITVTPANSTVAFTGNYTIAMVDADVVGTDESGGVNRHWLLNGVTVADGTVNTDGSTAITVYAQPGPAAGSGPHRYVILLYTQPDDFHPPAEFQSTIPGVSKFDLNAYVQDSGLGAIVAGSYFTVEEGTATVSISPTSAVITSTLASAAGTGGAAPSVTGTGTGTGTGAAPAKSNSAAIKMKSTPFAILTAAFFGLLL